MRTEIDKDQSPRMQWPPSPQTLEAQPPHFDAILELAASVNQLHHRMADTCAPIVQDLIQSRSRDRRQIESTLDRLLDCACIPEGLALFRSLCRYYYPLNPAATARYVRSYSEMWDSEDIGEEEAQR